LQHEELEGAVVFFELEDDCFELEEDGFKLEEDELLGGAVLITLLQI